MISSIYINYTKCISVGPPTLISISIPYIVDTIFSISNHYLQPGVHMKIMQKNAVARYREFSLQALFIVVEGFQQCDVALSLGSKCVRNVAILYLWIYCCPTIYISSKQTRIQINNDTQEHFQPIVYYFSMNQTYDDLNGMTLYTYYNAMLVSHDLLQLRRSITILIVAYVLFWFFADNVIFHVLLTRTTNVCINIAEYFFHVILHVVVIGNNIV